MAGTTISSAYLNGLQITDPNANPLLLTGTISNTNASALTVNTGAAFTVTNQGLISASGSGDGIDLTGGGLVVNQAGHLISGAANGVLFSGTTAGTVDNAGTIAGGADAVQFQSGQNNLLIARAGAVFSGTVDGGNTIGATAASTLELASGASAGTLSGLGTQFVDFAQLLVQTGATWNLAGSNSIATGMLVTNDGTLIDAGSLTNAGSITAGIRLAPGALLTNSGTIPAGVYGNTGGASTVINSGPVGAVLLDAGGSVTNAVGGTITGYDALWIRYGVGTIVNAGLVNGAGNAAIVLSDGGSAVNQAGGSAVATLYGVALLGSATTNFTNQSGGVVTGGKHGVFMNTPGTLLNAGSITGTLVAGVNLLGNASVTNQAGGVIHGANGVYANGNGNTVVNQSTITGYGTAGSGVVLHATSTITNASGGTILGTVNGAYAGAASSVVNSGSIGGGTAGVSMFYASLTNQAGGVITGKYAVDAKASSTVTNAGTLGGTTDAVRFAAGFSQLLVVRPGAVFTGTVEGGNTIGAVFASTLELASSASVGQIGGIGSQFVDFARVNVDSGASWTLVGANTLASGVTLSDAGTLTSSSTLANNGAIVLNGGILTAAALSGSGVTTLSNGATLEAQGAVASGETISFAGAGLLHLDAPVSMAGTVTGFGLGETIDLAGIDPNSVSFSGGTLSFAGGSFALTAAGAVHAATSGDGAALSVVCFRAGTHIVTARGEVAVEDLQPGDRVRSLLDGTEAPVQWIGRRFVDCRQHPRPELVWPVRVTAGAFGSGRPWRDLWLSPDHAVFVDDVLIPVKLLINGTTIAQVRVDTVTYHHVELPQHAVLLAEGLPAESYLDVGDRCRFDNGGGPVMLHPDFSTRAWEAEGCAPLVITGPVLDAVRRRLGGQPARRSAGARRAA